jgi:Glycosyl transferase family 2
MTAIKVRPKGPDGELERDGWGRPLPPRRGGKGVGGLRGAIRSTLVGTSYLSRLIVSFSPTLAAGPPLPIRSGGPRSLAAGIQGARALSDSQLPESQVPRVAAVIPAYQAAPSVGAVVAGVQRLLPEVLVVDDGSTDGTAAAAAAAGARVVSLPANRGKGAALAAGFRDLFGRGFTAVVTLDADGQHLPEEIPSLLAAAAAGADLVLGVRDHLFVQMSGVRRTSNRLSSAAISLAAGQRLSDVQTGFRLYTRRLIADVGFPESRFEAESAVVVRAARRGFRVVTVPVRLGFADGRTSSHYRPLVDSLRIARAVLRARVQSTTWRRSS